MKDNCDVCGKMLNLKKVETSGGVMRVCASCILKKKKKGGKRKC
jgi:ribosome-binding protein aMBF1 (putative translation factor)